MLTSLLYCVLAVIAFQSADPQFKGGSKNLYAFLERNMIYPEFSKYNCLQGTVEVSFSITRSGKIYRSSVTKGFGTDLDVEALRIVRLTSGRWEVPAGYDTTVSVVLPVSFALKGEPKCAEMTKADINSAIAAYRSYEGLTKVILNFYDNKFAGKADESQTGYIAGLKQELGYDDRFIDRLLKRAGGKLKQGDREGACEDLNFIRRIGSDRADKQLALNCIK